MQLNRKAENHPKQDYKNRSRFIVHKTLQFRINLLFILLMLASAVIIIVVVQTIGKSLMIQENYRYIEQKGRTIVEQLGQRINYAEALAKSLANIAETIPKDEQLYKKTVSQILYGKESHVKVAGGGIWPEPYVFDPEVERRSFFWGYGAENTPVYFNDYNDLDGPGYHLEEWYVPARYLKKTDTYWSQSYIDPYSNEPMVTTTIPIFDGKKFSGVSTVDLKLNDLKIFLDKEATVFNGYIFAVDRNNKFLSFPDQSYVKTPAKLSKKVEEFINVTQLSEKEPQFLKIAMALEVMNRQILDQSLQDVGSNNELAQAIASESYQINLHEAQLIVAMFIRPSGKLISTNFKPITIENDFLLNEPAVASFFLMPKTYWKIVIVSSQTQVTKVANRISQQILIYLSIGMLLSVFIAYLYLRYILIMPLRDMTKQLIRTVRGQGEQLVTLPETPKNEIGDLAFWFNRRTEELRNSNKKLNHEIMSHKKSQESLKESEHQLSIHLQNTPIGAITWDLHFKVLEWNPAAERIFGYTREEAIGKHAIELILSEEVKDVVQDTFQELSNDCGGERSTNENITKAGRRILCDWYNTTLKDTDGNVTGVASLVNDITFQKKNEEMMIQSEKMMSVGGLAAGMAHELNNPLAGMMQNAQVIHNRLTTDLPANNKIARELGTSMPVINKFMEKRGILDQLASINQAGIRAAKIIQNMLSFAKKSDSVRNEHEINELIDNTIELAQNDYDLKKKYDFKQIEIIRQYGSNIPSVLCEGSKIQQVFFNIIKNASEAMSLKQHRNYTPEIIIRIRKLSKMACIEIEDNGPGIDQETRKRIFEPFFTTKSVDQGTGLGLSVSYFIIVDDHRGKMEVESVLGKGTKFIIKLPI